MKPIELFGSRLFKSIFTVLVLAVLCAPAHALGPSNVLSLDGGTDRAEASATVFPDTDGLDSFTVEAWIYPTASARYVITDDAYDLILNFDSGQPNNGVGIIFNLWGPSEAMAMAEYRDVKLNQWNHIAIMFDAYDAPDPQMSIAINGILSDTPLDFTLGSLYTSASQHFTVGGLYQNSTSTFEGAVGEVMVSDIVRYTSDFSPPSSFIADANTRGLWYFNETAGATSFADSSGNNFTLTAVDAAASATASADTDAPVTTASPAGGAYFSAQDVTLACTDYPGGCNATYYCLGASCNPTTVYSEPISVTADTDLRFYSTDPYANAETVVTESYSITQYYALDMYVQGSGNGSVLSSPVGIDCGYNTTGDCTEVYAEGQQVTLTAAPESGSSFDGWSGVGCSGTVNPCVFTIATNSPVFAQFGVSNSSADLGVTITGTPDPVSSGQAIIYTVDVQNYGPDTASAVVLSNPISSGLAYIGSSATQGSCSFDGINVTCSLGDLANSATASVDITVVPNMPADAVNDVFVSSNSTDPNAANDSASVTTPVYPLMPGEVDFDGDGIKDVAIFRPSAGKWFFTDMSQSFFNSIQFGQAGDIPVPADYDGDGVTEVAIFRPSAGKWFFTDMTQSFFNSIQFGGYGDIPVPGDYDGVAGDEVAIFRPSVGKWFFTDMSQSFFTSVQFGQFDDIPVPGYYTGSLNRNIAIYRPSVGKWFFTDMNQSFFKSIQFGAPGDVLVPRDYDDTSGGDEVAIYRPSAGKWFFTDEDLAFFNSIQFGSPGDIPIPADFDGTGPGDEVAIYRPSVGKWFFTDENLSYLDSVQFGQPGDIPITGDYDGDWESNIVVVRPSVGRWFFTDYTTSFFNYFNFYSVGDYTFGLSASSNPGIVPMAVPAQFYFDDGSLQGWSATGLWHVASRDFSTSPYSVHYGLEASALPGASGYNTGSQNTGTLTSPAFNLDTASSLSFEYSLDGECTTSTVCNYDRLALEISTDLGTTWTSLTGTDGNGSQSLPDTGAGVFSYQYFDLSAYDGLTVMIRFTFDSISSSLNDFEGAYVDDININ